MENTIFFAWQLDTPRNTNKDFIWKALKHTADRLSNDAQPELSPRPERDTEGSSGNPNIIDTIFRRISRCSIFVADITLVAETPSGKKSPNPNVLLELGYAANVVGWNRTILVMNEDQGPRDDLPFDILQHRWPIKYRLTSDSIEETHIYNELKGDLLVAHRACYETILSRARDMFAALDSATIELVAKYENSRFIPLPDPRGKLGRRVVVMQFNDAARRLVDMGAIQLSLNRQNPQGIGYHWTSDGKQMIKLINTEDPGFLEHVRELEKQYTDK